MPDYGRTIYIAQLKERISALGDHQEGIVGAVFLDEDVGCPGDVRGVVTLYLQEYTAVQVRRDYMGLFISLMRLAGVVVVGAVSRLNQPSGDCWPN